MKPCQTSEMKLFPQVITARGELRILPYIYDEAFCKNSQKQKAVHYFAKISILDVWQVSEYASTLASKVKDVSYKLLLGKKNSQPNFKIVKRKCC